MLRSETSGPPDDILLVDDHVATSRLVTDLLEIAFPGLVFASARTAAEAIESCALRLPRLVILDIGLPDSSGIEVARRIKAMSAAVKIVVHSNHDHSIYREESAAAGADVFVSKVRTFADLVPAVARLLNLQPRRRLTSGNERPER